MYALVLLTLVASAAASVYVDGPCPVVKPVDNFNVDAWASDIWFETARYPNSREEGGNCGWADMRAPWRMARGDVFSVLNFDVAKGKLRLTEVSAQLAEDAGMTGKLTYSYPNGADGAITKNTLWVLGTDYVNYAVVYSCKYNEEKKSRQDFAWLFSRITKLDGAAKAAVDKIVKENAFLDASKMIQVDFSEAACKIVY